MHKTDYKLVKDPGLTFGNDKLFTGKNFRQSYAISISSETLILTIPIRVIDEVIKKLANTGENKEKTDFFKHFDWFGNFTQSLKTKFNNLVTKKTFYPGAFILNEGQNSKMCYVIVEGTCNFFQNQAGEHIAKLDDNPADRKSTNKDKE